MRQSDAFGFDCHRIYPSYRRGPRPWLLRRLVEFLPKKSRRNASKRNREV